MDVATSVDGVDHHDGTFDLGGDGVGMAQRLPCFASNSCGYRVSEFDSRLSPVRVPLDKALCLRCLADSASE